MDKLEHYRQILQRLIAEQAELAPQQSTVEVTPICDVARDHYLLVDMGWNTAGRVHAILIHLRLHNGKVWVEWDGTDQEIVQQLLVAGIAKEDIVLAFYHPEERAHTEFAVA